MKSKLLVSTMLLALLALPVAAQAQGTVRGAERGAAQGERDAGPLGAVVGGLSESFVLAGMGAILIGEVVAIILNCAGNFRTDIGCAVCSPRYPFA